LGGCASGVICMSSSCGRFADGQPCTANSQCQSDLCAQGVCCDTPCAGLCRSCSIPGSVGHCMLAPAGTDPLAQCKADARPSCGQTGECDGTGHCQLWPAGTMCLPRRCSAGAVAQPAYCNGSGTCVPGLSTACTPYACDPSSVACFTSCIPDAGQCASSAQCTSSGCQ
jgi:hypothetical protein